jgi:hypothetical protein
VKNYIPPQIYLYDFRKLFGALAIVVAIAVIVYSALFGRIW